MTDIRTLKNQLRGEALARRDALDSAYRIEAALRLADDNGSLPFDPGAVIAGYLPIRSELDIRPLMMALAARGARLCVPAMLDKTDIEFRALVRGAPLVANGFGTVAPGPEAEVLVPDIILMPLAAFDSHGTRIGYGAGYYDRAISKLRAEGRNPRLVAMAFDCQEVEHAPSEAHDIPLPAVWTEAGLRGLPG